MASSRRKNPSDSDAAVRARLKIKLAELAAERERQRRVEKLAAQRRRGVKRTLEYKQSLYQKKLKAVRQFVKGFDTKKFDVDRVIKPSRSLIIKKSRTSRRRKVTRLYKKLEPFLKQTHKIVRPRLARNIEAVRDYAAVPKIKGLKAIPVRTVVDPEKVKVTVDKKARVQKIMTIKGHVSREKLYLFPRKPHNPDDLEDMAGKVIARLPDGFYIVITDTHDLIPSVRSKSLLLDEIRRLSYPYRFTDDASPEGEAKRFRGFVQRIRGFKWLGSQVENAGRYQSMAAQQREIALTLRRNQWAEHDARVRALIKKRRARSERERKRGRR